MCLFISLLIYKVKCFNEFKFPNKFPSNEANLSLSDLREEIPSKFTRSIYLSIVIASKYNIKQLLKINKYQ